MANNDDERPSGSPRPELDAVPVSGSIDRPATELAESLAASILERIAALSDLSASIAQEEFVSAEPAQLALAIGRLARAMRPEVVTFLRQHRTNAFAVNRLRGVDIQLLRLTGDLRWAERATAARVPGVLTRLVASKVQALIPNAAILLRPVWNYDYKIQPTDIHKNYSESLRHCFNQGATRKLDEALSGLRYPLFVISFPIVERRSIHLHSVLGHEVGHLIARDYEQTQASEKEYGERFRERFTVGAHNKQKELFEDRHRPEYIRGEKACMRAMKEYAADAAGVHILGISALLGAAEIALANGLSQKVNKFPTHPAWCHRLLKMLDLVRASGWMDLQALKLDPSTAAATEAVEKRLGQIEAWARSDPSISRPATQRQDAPVPSYEELGQNVAMNAIDDIRTFVAGRCGPVDAQAATTYQRLPALLRRMKDGLPPDSYSDDGLNPQPAELQDILAAAWWHRLSAGAPVFNDDGLSDDCLNEANVLRKITLKAIENVDFIRTYRDKVSRARAGTE